ncbi:Dedicator of cytokinesis protein 6 [Coelomomyces lativittatus]|nr:Dedicator of cytokinesis protein 6 [Coelomomyces lativittatus]
MKTVIESISQVILNRIKLDKILDFESKLACFHQIANGYFNIPDLRLDTLCAMSDLNEAQGRYMEAALSCLHAAALVSEFLLHRFPKRPGSMGAKAFGSCNSNLLEESMTHTLFQQLHFVSPLFSETGLTQLLQRIIALCIQAHLYDLLIPMSKLLFPIYEVKKQWNALAELHLALSNTFQSLTTGSTSKENTGGTYFRVAFLGDMWDEDLKQQVFVYRMDPSYTLPAFSEEMKSTFKFLGDALLIHLGPSDPSEPPKPQTALLHITLLEPLPPSTFNHSTLSVEMIHQFVYLVPFHLDESTSHGTMATQCLRQFQLTTVHPFPYLVNRLPILQTTQETFPPIQVATQVLNARTSMLTSILTNPIEFPKLQRLLHMMFELPEDQAPMHMVHTFLTASVPDSEPRNENVLGLKRALSAFLRQCELGVTVTRQAGPDDKKNIQQELEQKFEALRTALEPHLVSESKVEPKDEEEEKMLKRVEAFLGSTMDLNSFLGSE